MIPEKPIYLPSAIGENSPLRQGEILSNLIQIYLDIHQFSDSMTTPPRIFQKIHPYAIILSQDCDLEQDHKARGGENPQDKLIPSILFCEVVTAGALRGSKGINSSIWNDVKRNNNVRYYFLQRVDPKEDALQVGLPELGIDFKRYFTVPTDEVYRRVATSSVRRQCMLQSPYREHFSTRFASFLCRIALPQDHLSV